MIIGRNASGILEKYYLYVSMPLGVLVSFVGGSTFENSLSGADTEAGAALFEIGDGGFPVANSAGGFDAHGLADGTDHDIDRFGSGGTGAVAGGGFDEVRAGGLGQLAGGDDLVWSEVAGFEDDFDEGLMGTGFGDDGLDILLDELVAAGEELTDIHDHVDFVGALLQGQAGFGGFDIGAVGAVGEADNDAGFDGGAFKVLGGQGDIAGTHTKRGGLIVQAEFATVDDILFVGVGLQDGMVNGAGDLLDGPHGVPFLYTVANPTYSLGLFCALSRACWISSTSESIFGLGGVRIEAISSGV